MEIKISKKPVSYNKAMKFLNDRVNDIHSDKNDELIWILEHPNLYTAGISATDNDLLDKNKFPTFKTNRGGKWTFHGKGQKIVYFILDLNKRGKAIRALVNKIQDIIILSLKEIGIKAHKDKNNIGIWVNTNGEEAKIAAIGIKVKKWIAYHGFSLNVNVNKKNYKGIIPCGIKNKGIANISDFKKNIHNEKLNKILIKNFLDQLQN
tara:strand:- start:324 stop:944 length:621 start_codon:yes stop_codon:yes gene_type:complete